MEVFFTSYLMGGLGNQMFQISHALSQGWKNSVPVIFKCESYTKMQGSQPTKYKNNIFRKLKFTDNLPPAERLTNMWEFKELNVNPAKNIEFFGYFQSSKNFYGFDKEIQETFLPDEDFLNKIHSLYPQLNNKNNISIHIRRGDYLKVSNILPVVDISYIDKCLDTIKEFDNIFVLTDDKEWVEKNIKRQNLIIPKNLEDYEELWLIGLCKYNIMSNSTFSWWGSFLNTNPDKVVFVPDTWFGPQGEKNYEDLYESDWNKIKVEYKNGRLICY